MRLMWLMREKDLVPDSLSQQLSTLEEVKQAYPYVVKPAILKSETEIHGVVLKGVDSLYNADFYKGYLKDGGFPVFSSLRPSDDILLLWLLWLRYWM
ncbi:MAG: hypothetical protein V8S95_00615 [Odoribacter sp.]